VHSTRLSERHLFPLRRPPKRTFSTEWPINRGLAVEMTLRGRDDGASATMGLAALGAWKPAKDAGFHIPTATATAAVKLGQTAKPPPIVHFYRFSCRTEKSRGPISPSLAIDCKPKNHQGVFRMNFAVSVTTSSKVLPGQRKGMLQAASGTLHPRLIAVFDNQDRNNTKYGVRHPVESLNRN
jgi:hypothetical protein